MATKANCVLIDFQDESYQGGVISISCPMFWPIESCPCSTHETHNTMQSQTCTLYGQAVVLYLKSNGVQGAHGI